MVRNWGVWILRVNKGKYSKVTNTEIKWSIISKSVMIVIFVEFIDQLIDYPINRASLNPIPLKHMSLLFHFTLATYNFQACTWWANTLRKRQIPLWFFLAKVLMRCVRAIYIFTRHRLPMRARTRVIDFVMIYTIMTSWDVIGPQQHGGKSKITKNKCYIHP